MASGAAGRIVRGAAWLSVAAIISLGASGLVAGASLPPTDAARPELTARGDAAVAPGLATLRTGLIDLQGQVSGLLGTGEQVLVDLAAMTSDTVTATQVADDLQEGDRELLTIETNAQALQAAYAQLPYDASSDHISGSTKGRLASIRQALDTVAPVTADWQAVSTHATVAARLFTLMRQHVAAASQAVMLASDKDASGRTKVPDLAGALAALDQAAAILTQAGSIRDQLVPTTDMSTYDQWVALHQAYEAALGRYLRAAQTTSDSRVLTPLFEQQKAAYLRLPTTTAPLVAILDDLQATGLTDGVAALQRISASLVDLAQVD
ncbi:MAG: hypothetical protein ACHQZR_04875 [Candidatus Limnocylindrales bacterium]